MTIGDWLPASSGVGLLLKPVPKVRAHLRSRQKAKKQCKKTWKKHIFVSVFFHFCLDRSKCNPWRNLYFFNFWGTCCKKKHDFLHFCWHFFHFPPHFTRQKMHDKFKKSAFFSILLYITQQKKFFSTCFLHFFDEKILNFSPHYKTFFFSFLLCSSYGKHLKKRQYLRSYWLCRLIFQKNFFCPMMSIVDFFSIHFQTKLKKSKFFFCSQSE